MDHSIFIMIIASIGAFFMAFNNGANDVSNAFAPAVGSKAISIKQALLIAAVLNLFGSVMLGSNVALTMINKILPPEVVQNGNYYIMGMIACLVASGLFVLLSTLTSMPVSSTHAIVGSLTGVVIAIEGWKTVNWKILGTIALSWVISPVLAGILCWISIKIIRLFIFKPKNKQKILKRLHNWIPALIALTSIVTVYYWTLKSKSPFLQGWFTQIQLSILLSIAIFFTVRLLIGMWIKKSEASAEGAEGIFKKLQVGTACYVAFAHGSNDVSNSISPVLAILMVLEGVNFGGQIMTIPIWVLLIGGLGMSFGIMLLGHKVMATLGHKITLITNSKGFCIDFSTATTVTLASILGMPVSTTHAATGSVVGVGLEKGLKGINLSLFIKIFAAWVITVPCAALITIVLFYLFKGIGKFFSS